MATFNLAQVQPSKNLYIYPNGDLGSCVSLTAFGDASNYLCVDEDRLSPDEDATYVWWNGIVAALDLYEAQDHTTETGTINYVQVYARAKSHEIAPHEDAIYKIVCSPTSTCSIVFKSSNIDLITSYMTYNKTWEVNPDDTAAWEWADIDALCIGVECSSPSIAVEYTTTLLSNALGSAEEFSTAGMAGANWDFVNEYGGYLWATRYNNAYEEETYELQNTAATGTITNVAVFAIMYGTSGAKGKIMINSNGTKEYGTEFLLPIADGTWTSAEFATDPDTGVAWTWAGINALQAGCAMNPSTYRDAKFRYLRATVYYSKYTSPEIRTTQSYAKVNYSTDESCDLMRPEHISTDHARNIKMLNFWDGSREVYDVNRSGKSMVLTGRECYAGACSRLLCVRNMGIVGEVVTISGLGFAEFNGDFRIREFGWKKLSSKPLHYEWVLSLEDAVL